MALKTQKKKSWVSGQVRAERILAEAITIDGRKEWTCKFCSESKVWTGWRCRRCHNDIPAGLHGKKKQAVASGKFLVISLHFERLSLNSLAL